METAKGKNDAKHRGRGEEIVNVEKAIKERQKELAELRHEQEILQASVERYRVYKDFLEQVEEKIGDGSTVDEIIARFHTLTNTYAGISKQMDQLHETKDQLVKNHAEQMKV